MTYSLKWNPDPEECSSHEGCLCFIDASACPEEIWKDVVAAFVRAAEAAKRIPRLATAEDHVHLVVFSNLVELGIPGDGTTKEAVLPVINALEARLTELGCEEERRFDPEFGVGFEESPSLE